MTDKKLTDEEIIKALKCCSNQMYVCTDKQCRAKTSGNAIDFINRQKAEIEKLNIQLQGLWNMASLYKAESERWEGYNENLLTANTVLSNEILEAKAKAEVEAYKEFAEKVKEEWFCNGYDSPDVDFDDFIANLLKEMVGEEEENNEESFLTNG